LLKTSTKQDLLPSKYELEHLHLPTTGLATSIKCKGKKFVKL